MTTTPAKRFGRARGSAPPRPYARAAWQYLERGWQPIPVLDGGKGKVPAGVTGYEGKPVTAEDAAKWSLQHPEANVALRLCGQVGLDVDAYDAKPGAANLQRLSEELGDLPPTVRLSSRFGDDYDGASGIRLYRLPAEYIALQGKPIWRSCWPGIDVIRFGHRQVVAPPSIHPERRTPYRWLDERTGAVSEGVLPAPETLPLLPQQWCQALIKPVAASNGHVRDQEVYRGRERLDAPASRWWTGGSPCSVVRARLGQVEAELGMARHDAARDGVLALTRLGEQGHQGVRKAIDTLHGSFLMRITADGSRDDHTADGEWVRFTEAVDTEIERTGLTDSGQRSCCSEERSDGPWSWQPIQPFQNGCPVPFPVDALPIGMAAAVREVAQAVQVDAAIPGTAFLGVAAALVGARTTVRITATWVRLCTLYLVVVAETGVGKTPGMTPALAPATELEQQVRDAAEQDRRLAKALLPDLRDQLKERLRDGCDEEDLVELQREIDKHERAERRRARVLVDDVTPERLAGLMADNDGRMLAWNDEGSMVKHALGMYAATPNLDLFLKAWDATRYVVDRKGSGGQLLTELVLEHPTLSLVAAVQPTTIQELGLPRHRDLIDRGLVGRLLVSWPPSRLGTRLLSGREHRAYRHVDAWNESLSKAVLAGDRELAFSDAAQALFLDWHDSVERGLPPGRVFGDVKEFAVKIRDSVARIAGLFARLEGHDEVEQEHVARAIQLGDYYIAHAEAVVESWAGNAIGVARKIISKVDRYTFTVRDATRWARPHRVEEVIEALEVLQARGYVEPADPSIGFGGPRRVGGRSPEVLLNPDVLLLSPAVPVVPQPPLT